MTEIRPIRTRITSPQAPQGAPPTTRLARCGARLRLAGLAAIALLLLAFAPTVAQASHFRGASLTWKRLASPPNTIELTITEAWRVGATDTLSYSWGDGSAGFSSAGATVIATDPDFTVIRKVLTHTYVTEGPWTISGSSCCRIGNLVNSGGSSEQVQTVVDLRGGNQGPPIVTSPIIIQMVRGGLNTVPLSFADVDGDAVTFRMATLGESLLNSIASAGGFTLAVSPSGVLTWNTSGTTVGQLYAAQVIANDNHPLVPTGVGGSRVAFDFIIKIVDGTLNRPPVASGNAGPFVAAIGVPFSNVITGTDPDGGNLTVTHQGLPSGGTLTPVSGTTAPQPLAATFNWTPSLSDAGSSVGITIVFTDPGGLQASKSFSISVPANQPPVANAGPDVAVFDRDLSNVATTVNLNGTGSYDPEHVALTYSWVQTAGPLPFVTLSGPNTATPSFTAPSLAEHSSGPPPSIALTFQLTVSDGKSSRTDDVTITVKHENLPPVAVASAPAAAAEAALVTLDGSGSNDGDGDSLTYAWTQLSGTPVVLTTANNDPRATFAHMITGPHCASTEGLSFELTVSDGIDSSTTLPITVTINNVNQPPTADAGHPETVCETAALVTLDGSGTDPDGDSISLAWTQVAGPAVSLADADTASPSFAPPAVTAAQASVTLTFKLTVSDACGATDPDALTGESTVDITVTHANRAPAADAGPLQTVPEGSAVTLDGSASFDPDGDAISYAWVQTGGASVVLSDATAAQPSFTAPNVGPAGDLLTFELVVTDQLNNSFCGQSLASAPSTATVVVQYVNHPPTAGAGAGQNADEGVVVTLHGSGSDPDGNPLTFTWTQLSGPAASLDTTDPANPTFTAPPVPCAGDIAVFQVTVDDGYGGQATAETSVTIANVNNAPVADAGANQSVPELSSVMLNASLSSDPDGESLSYSWQQVGAPLVVLADANSAHPTFTAPAVTAGGDPNASVTLTFEVLVTDTCGGSATDLVEVKVTNVDHAPTARAGGGQTVCEAVTVVLNGAGSSDPDGDPLTYSWIQVAGTTVVLSGANTATPTFVAPFVGPAGDTLVFALTVDDGFGGANTDTATIAILNCNTPPDCGVAKASSTSLWPPNHAMIPITIVGVRDPESNATITVTSVTQDEAINGLGDGDTGPDAVIQGSTVLLRAERSGKGNGRVYHIHYTAADLEGSCSGVVTVSVPHDKRGDVAIDGGELFNSTGH